MIQSVTLSLLSPWSPSPLWLALPNPPGRMIGLSIEAPPLMVRLKLKSLFQLNVHISTSNL